MASFVPGFDSAAEVGALEIGHDFDHDFDKHYFDHDIANDYDDDNDNDSTAKLGLCKLGLNCG